MLVKAIIEKLKTGSIKNVVLFADDMKIPPPPYVVVKSENGTIPGTRQYRITMHTEPGYSDDLNEYIFVELAELLLKDKEGNKVKLTDDKGRIYYLNSGEWFDVRPEESDNTICMERIFFIPFKISQA